MILDYLEQHTKTQPEKVVLIDEDGEMSLKEFTTRAKALATMLLQRGVEKSCVAVEASRKKESVVGFFACLYSGNFFMPIDEKTPKARLEKMMALSQPACCLSVKEKGVFADCESVLSIESATNVPVDIDLIERAKNAIISADAAYVIWTSGSTGDPKAVVINHGQIMGLVRELDHIFQFLESDILGNQSPFYFDGAMKDLFIFAYKAAAMAIIPQKCFLMPLRLVEFLNTHQVTTLLWASSAWQILYNANILQTHQLPYVDKLSFAGEALSTKTLNYLIDHIGGTIVNLYGPTETTVDACYYEVQRKFNPGEVVPIGKAFRDLDVFLLDDDLKVTDKKGQIAIRGARVSKGYYGNPKKTREVFIQDPRQKNYEEKIYLTGDIAYYNDAGELVFSSRADNQIKHMGHRIELGEIEYYLNAMDGVESGICLYDKEKSQIAFVYTGEALSRKDVFVFLSDKLPKYMIPTILVKIDDMPLNRNKKIDRTEVRKCYEKSSV